MNSGFLKAPLASRFASSSVNSPEASRSDDPSGSVDGCRSIPVASGSRLVGELDATLQQLRDIGVQHRGHVMMACVPAVARSLMPKCVEYCLEKWPNVSLSIDDSAATEVVRKVARGEVEFGIASGKVANSELHVEPLVEDPFRLWCRRDDPMAASRWLPGASSRGVVSSC